MTTRALLLIADIGGYTRFMRLHRMSLVHAQENTARLLEAVIDAAPRLTLVGLEGDAAFLYAPDSGGGSLTGSVGELALRMHRAFHAAQEELASLRVCVCDGCVQTGRLRIKFVAHLGDVVDQTVKRRTSLAGVDVIVVHRMLKNEVPVPEYLLLSEPLAECAPPVVREHARPIEQELEGIGSQTFYYVDLEQIAEELPSPPAATRGRRFRHATTMTLRTLPAILGVGRRAPSREPEATPSNGDRNPPLRS